MYSEIYQIDLTREHYDVNYLINCEECAGRFTRRVTEETSFCACGMGNSSLHDEPNRVVHSPTFGDIIVNSGGEWV